METALGFSSFSVADGRAITLVAAEGDAGEIAQTCVALDAQTGEQLWSYALNKHDYGRHGGGAGARGNKGGDGPRSTPTIDGDRVYVYDAQLLLVCLKADSGELIWKVDVLNDFQGSNINWSNAISPVVDGERVYVAGGGAGQSMMALNKLTGEVIWKTGDEEMTHATPIVREIQGKQQVIFFMQSGLIALNPTDGVELWRVVVSDSGELVLVKAVPDAYEELARAKVLKGKCWSTPAYSDGKVYVRSTLEGACIDVGQ
jgi:outer membrane protein assembly factor BamB